MNITEQIGQIADTTSGIFNPLHEVVDRNKVTALAIDMAEHGWHGAPVVVDSENAYTGVHRIAAVAHLGNTEGIEVQVPYVEISDLCELYDIDWQAILDEFDGGTYEAAASLRTALPRKVVDYLGYDVDGAL